MLSNQASDEDWLWIEKFQGGDPSGFNEIFNKYKSRVVNLSYRFVRNQEAAEDIAQEVFLKVYEKKVHHDAKAKFSTWLYRVTVNASLDFIRKKKFVGRSLDEETQTPKGRKETLLERLIDPRSSSLTDTLEKEELKAIVQKEISQLPEKLRLPILLYQFEEMPYREIAKILGLSQKAVERRIYHAKERLKSKFSKYL